MGELLHLRDRGHDRVVHRHGGVRLLLRQAFDDLVAGAHAPVADSPCHPPPAPVDNEEIRRRTQQMATVAAF
ncbi:MAG: hypothetical protein ACRDSK_31875 [Actinophytocola sp.]|uniref:hypothetical protein n=1 Tax=Actinophytocola sp. TaxID=1872138 RepID=UPI003D6C14D3